LSRHFSLPEWKMSAAKQLLDHKLLRTLSPLCDLPPDMLAELSGKSRVEQVVAGATIFTVGERDHRTLYLVAGTLELTDAAGKSTTLKANTQQARQPLDPEKPHRYTAVAKTAVSLLNIDTSLLEMLLGWGSKQSYEVSSIAVEEEEETDWMSRFLQSKVFLKLRAENIQSMLMRMEEIKVREGEIVINQDDVDDNYYIIAKGRARVARRVVPGAPEMKLAILTAGTGFGEEALISDCKRNASVTMMEDGTLMRLGKEDFINLLVTPILQYVSFEKAQTMRGPDVQWLDVRKLDEFSRGSLPDAKNIPLAELRLGIRKLNKLHKYIVFSDKGGRAGAAVFLLNQQGLDAYVLSDGLATVPSAALEKLEKAAAVPTLQTPAQPDAQVDNKVVNLRGEATTGVPENDGRVEALMSKAKQRVQQEMQRTQVAENARKQAQEEVTRLKAEAEAARQQVEVEARRAADQARSEAERAAAQKRADEMAEQQAEREAAVKRVQIEVARAEQAEAARAAAEGEIDRIKQETAQARREMEEQTKRAAEKAKQDAEGEIIRLKAEAEMARQRVEEQARLAADQARTETERQLAQQRAEETSRQHQEMENALQKAELEAMRAQQAEVARQQAEEFAEQMRQKAEETQREMEEQAHLAADQARSEAERDAARQRAEYLAEKQEEIEEAVAKAEMEAARAQAAESEVEQLKQQAEEARMQSEEQARLAVDAARSEVEREISAQRAEEMARLQAEREEMARVAEEGALRTKAAEEARQKAEAEIQRLKVDAEVARMQLEEQAQRVADAARTDADREASRATVAEEARLRAVNELERLEAEVDQARRETEVQIRLAADEARSEAEREASRLRAEELALQQKQLEAIAHRAEQETARAELADEARQRAENEIARRQAEVEEAQQRANAEAHRAQEAEAARQKMEDEMAQLRAEAAAARDQVEKQARLFATAQRIEAEETNTNRAVAMEAERRKREAEKQAARQKLEAEELERRELLAAQVTARRKQQAEEAARLANEEAERAQAVAEKIRNEAEQEILQLQAQAEASRFQAELEVKRSIVAAKREVDKGKVQQAAQAKARNAAVIQQRNKVDTDKARRTREAREAALRAIGKSNDDGGMDEFMELEVAAAEVAAEEGAIIVNEAQIEARAKDRENLIDPTEVMKVERQEQKRHWVSDDFIWEATLGYRTDPDVEALGSPSDSVGVDAVVAKTAEKPADKNAKNKGAASPSAGKAKPTTEAPLFGTQEINRNIRPQLDVPDRRKKRTFGVMSLVGAALFLAVVSGGGWYYISGDEAASQLGKVVGQGTQTFNNLKDKVTSTFSNLSSSDEAVKAVPAEGESKQADDEAMARLRERLESMKATANAKAEAKVESAKQALKTEPLPVLQVPASQEAAGKAAVSPSAVEPESMEPAAVEPVSVGQESMTAEAVPEAQAEPEAQIETVEDVMKALTALPAGPAESATPSEADVVESVDSLPIVDEAAGSPSSVQTPDVTPASGEELTAGTSTGNDSGTTSTTDAPRADEEPAASAGEVPATEAIVEESAKPVTGDTTPQ
jgi:rhodanese-related sulfurtransferase